MDLYLSQFSNDLWSPLQYLENDLRLSSGLPGKRESLKLNGPTVLKPKYRHKVEDNGVYLEIELPGVAKDDITIETKDHKLMVKGNRYNSSCLMHIKGEDTKDAKSNGEGNDKGKREDMELEPILVYSINIVLGISTYLENAKAKHDGSGLLKVFVPRKPESEGRRIEIGG